MQAFFI
jgi:phospholipid-transporting ATPase